MESTQRDRDREQGSRLLAGRYALGEAIGRGRSTVYSGQDVRLRRQVAIKRVQLDAEPEAAGDTRLRAMREAQAAARLSNPRAVTVFDVVEEAGSIWLVMELVDAPSLATIVVEEGPLGHRRAATVGLDVLDALDAAHAVGVVHRDVKPANVLVGAGDRAKLTDFGVARIRDDTKLTATGHIIGSPAYMAPEQARGESAGPAADLWALGATLYFAVEGTPPFPGTSAIAVATAVVHRPHRPPARPGPLTDIIDRLLSKDPGDRPAAGEIRRALRSVRRSPTPDRAGASGVDPAAGLAPTPGTPPSSAHVDDTAGAETEVFPALVQPGPAPAPLDAPALDDLGEQPEDDAASGAPPQPAVRAATSAASAAAAPPNGERPRGRAAGIRPGRALAGSPRAPAASSPDEGVVVRTGRPPTETPAARPPSTGVVRPTGSPSPAPDTSQGSGHTAAERHPRRPRGPSTADRGPRARLAGLVLTGLVALAAVALVVQRASDEGGEDSANRSGNDQATTETTSGTSSGPTTSAESPATTTAVTSTASAGATTTTRTAGTAEPRTPSAGSRVPDGWTPFTDPEGAYTIAHPPGWSVVRGSRDHTVYFREPGTGTYLLVEWTPEPKPDPVADWREQSTYFANRHEGYEELRIEPYPYRDYDAAMWEFRYRDGDTVLHSGNLGFVAAGRGYALYFQTREANWDSSQDTYARFREAFSPAP